MRTPLAILFFLVALYSCKDHSVRKEDISYVKVLIRSTEALKTTAYNKGLGAYAYSYFDLNKDSIVHLFPRINDDSSEQRYYYRVYQGNLDNPKYQDIVLQMIQALSWRPSGSVELPSQKGNTYDSWYYDVEIKKGTASSIIM